MRGRRITPPDAQVPIELLVSKDLWAKILIASQVGGFSSMQAFILALTEDRTLEVLAEWSTKS